MSYILDALKRADAERERGTVPSLRAQPAPLGSASPQRAASHIWLWIVLGVALAALLLAALAWRMTARETQVDRVAEQRAQSVPEAPAPPTTIQQPKQAAAAPAPITTVPAAAPIARPATPVAPARPPAPLPVIKEVPETIAKPEPKTAAKAPAVAAVPASAPAADSRIPSINELPDDIKRQLPPLSISGSIYSDNPAQRMLTIGSQVFQQGDKPAPDLVLEQIGPKSAVFSYKGTRYSVAY